MHPRYLILLIATLVASCVPVDKPPDDATDTTPAGSGCSAACIHARDDLHCEWANDTKKGRTCEETCERNEKEGVRWNTACIVDAKSCSEMASTCWDF